MTDEVNGAFGERLNCVAPLFIIRRPDNAAHLKNKAPRKKEHLQNFFFFFFPKKLQEVFRQYLNKFCGCSLQFLKA